MELKIEDLKVGDELECISCEAFVNDKVADKRVLNLKKIIVSGFFSTYVCVNDSGIANDHKLIIGNFRLKHFRKKPKLKFSDLEVGDYVYVRDSLEHGEKYGDRIFVDGMDGMIKGGFIEIHRKYTAWISNHGFDYTPEMIDLSRSMKKEDYLKMNETKKNKSFYELQEVAFQAYKDGLINSVAFENKLAPSLIRIDGNVIFDQHVSYKHDIDRIKSLYTEEFVIESEEDLKRIKDTAQITMPNKEILDYKDAISLERYTNSFILKLLKGATVTQSK